MSEAEILFDDYQEGQDLCQQQDFETMMQNYLRSKDNEQNN